MKNNLRKLAVVMLILQVMLLAGCKKSAETKGGDAALPFSDKVITGTLDNGMQYFIRENDFPSDKIELRLNVRSGSLNETDEERGLAHFVEHMAFNGTKNFKGNDVIKFMEDAGLVFGKDSNAATSSDYTNYQLTVPYDNASLFNTGLLILKDWASAITFDEEEIEKEKGIIEEEWRMRNDYRYRMSVESRKHVLNGSMYPERNPIGLMEIVNGANKQLLTGYYNKWYRPDNMAVIIVGNIDAKKVEKMVIDTFSDIAPKEKVEPVSQNVNYPKGIRVAIVSDKEAKGIGAALYIYHKGQKIETYNQFKEDMIETGAMNMFSRRMSLDIQEKKLDLLGLRGYVSLLGDNTKTAAFSGSFMPNTFDKSLNLMLTEIERVKRFGFTKEELEFFKTTQLSFLEQAAKPDYKFASEKYADQLSSYHTSGGYFTEFHQDKELIEKVFSETNLTSYNRAFQDLLKSGDMLLMILIPEQEKKNVSMDTAKFENMLKAVEESKISGIEEKAFTGKLIEEELTPAKVISKTEDRKLGAVKVVYENGLTLYIKDNKEEINKFIIQGEKLGGLSILENNEFLFASLMTTVIGRSGFENISKRNLDDLMAGKNVNAAPTVSEYTFGLMGGGFSDDMEEAFKLLYKYFTAATVDQKFLTAYINSLKTSIELEANDKKIQFARKATEKMYNDNYRRNYLLLSDLKNITADGLLKIYKDNYLDANNYIFTVAGDVDVEKVISFGAKYLGTIKPVDKKAEYKDRNVFIRDKYQVFEEYGDLEDKTSLSIMNMSHGSYDAQGRYIAGLARNILNIRMRELIREKESGAYSVAAYIRYMEKPKLEVMSKIAFPCKPSRKEDVMEKTIGVYKEFIANGIKEEELKSSALAMKSNYSSAVKENRYWTNTLTYNNLMGLEVHSLDEVNKIYDSLKVEDVNKFLKNNFTDSYTFISIFNPEKK